MNKKNTFLSPILFLSLAYNIGVPAPTLPSLTAFSTIVPAPLGAGTSTRVVPSPTSSPEPLGVFTLAVLVDITSEAVTREQAQTLVTESS